MKIYQTPISLNDDPMKLSVGIGRHEAGCSETNNYEAGGGFACLDEREIYVGGKRYMETLMHEVVEIFLLMNGCMYDSRWGNNTPAFMFDHDLFQRVIMFACSPFLTMLDLINCSFEAENWDLVAPKKVPPGWELIHDCDPQPVKKGRKKA